LQSTNSPHTSEAETVPVSALYDDIGTGYAARRQPDPRLAEPLYAALGDAATVLNVGAGAGSYEPRDRHVIAVEPSRIMISQRRPQSPPAVRAVADALPFPSGSFDAVMAVLTVHHWSNQEVGFAELRRVAPRRVVLTFDPEVHNRMWLMDYVPEIVELESARAPAIEDVLDGINGQSVTVLPVPHDCRDGMTIANWRHPAAYLDPAVHAGGSALRQVDAAALKRGLARLADDLETGKWLKRYGELMNRTELDCGLRLLVGDDR
jgi:SAM-dependent methyltransferase